MVGKTGNLNNEDLTEYFVKGCKLKKDFSIGTEHEKFGYYLNDLRPLSYSGNRNGIQDLLKCLTDFGWKSVKENNQIIGLSRGDASITLEPGGQIELSGARLKTVHETCREVHGHLDEMKKICAPLGFGLLGIGFLPKWKRGDIPWMPKSRYQIMRKYMPKKGSLGHDMMLRTCTVQVNLDYKSEADMVLKFRLGLALQPIVTALFSNSPFKEGKKNNFLSYRSYVWSKTDSDRCGMLPFVFDDGFSFERYRNYALDVPMYFVVQNGKYIDVSGESFRDFMQGTLRSMPGEYPSIKDWENHLSTLFPEVRLKQFLEMRGADAGPWQSLCALPAFWTGILYSDSSLCAAWDIVKKFSSEDILGLYKSVPRDGFKTKFRKKNILGLAQEILKISQSGLIERKKMDKNKKNEAHFLDPLFLRVKKKKTSSEELLKEFDTKWKKNIDNFYHYSAYLLT